jgi:hypothetical protein
LIDEEPNKWAVYQSKPLRSEIHRFEESEYARRGDVRARLAVGRDVAWRGVMKRANDRIDVEMDIGDTTRRSTSRYRGRVGRGTRTNEVGRTEYTN